MNLSLRKALFLGFVLAIATVLGQETSNNKIHKNLIKLGAGKLINNTSTTDLEGPLTPTGYRIDVNNPTGFVGSYTRFFGKHMGIEVLLGLPLTLKIEGAGEASFVESVGDVKVLPPTVLFNYYFTPIEKDFRPYLGIALNHTIFYNAESSQQLEETLFGETEIDLSSSTNIGGFAGLNYRIYDQYFASFIAGYVAVSTKATTTTDTRVIGIPIGIIEREIEVDLNPFVFLFTLGMSF
ncbi:OmpW family outer membrane protein [Aquimarina gracilis]|uniref:OmpW family outer membrane protein n=1 Tax=Aquimarina gracilis TaxID=874422 RepID=A0ABU5ZV41_9FLAO|nr:OmpW family outer membrane protein [Aquimarina gracilis]MEB3345874.1 OmpW family outer membrane protein [Aquimarina gracilis]